MTNFVVVLGRLEPPTAISQLKPFTTEVWMQLEAKVSVDIVK